MTHAAEAIQKKTSDAVVSHRQPVSTAVAYVADKYIPSGNTVLRDLQRHLTRHPSERTGGRTIRR
jgi:hypothetical protein